jgi:hypothetical protein
MRYLFLILFIISSSLTKAQIVKNVQQIGWRGGTDNVRLKSFPNKDRSLNCVVINTPDSLIAKVYNSKLEVVYSFKTINYKSEFSTDYTIGGFFRGENIIVVLKNDQLDYLINIVYNTKTGDITRRYTSSINKTGKNYALTINTGGDVLYLSTGKKTPFLSIINFDDNQNLKETIFDLNKGLNTGLSDKEMLKTLSSKDESGYDFNISFIDDNIKTSALEATSKNKLYNRVDSLILSSDDKFSETKIFSLNLINGSTKYKVINYDIPRNKLADNIFIDENSTIIGNTLYHLFANIEQLTLSVSNLYSLKLLAQYNVYKEENIDFKNTNIIQNGTFGKKDKVQILNTQKLISKIVNGKIITSGILSSNKKHELTIGAYNRKESNSYYASPMVSGGFIGGAIAGGLAVALTNNRSWDMVTRFKTLFDPITGEHIKGDILDSGTDLISDYTKDIKMPNQGSDTFFSDGNTYYSYYNNDTKSLEVIELK